MERTRLLLKNGSEVAFYCLMQMSELSFGLLTLIQFETH